MAKSDFCFTFYDGDATREMAHMNRLERGAYIDVVIQQRQRGHLSKEDIKKFLSKDFDAVWPALEWVLKTTPDGKFFVEWLDASETRAKKHSQKQRENRTKHQPKPNLVTPNKNLVPPLGDGDGDGIEKKDINGVPKEFATQEQISNWEQWGNDIVNENDPVWDGDARSRKIDRQEMDAFLSVAARNDWFMPTQGVFRLTLRGFDVNKFGSQTNGKIQPMSLKGI